MGGSRPITGPILGFALASSKGDVPTGEAGGGDEGLRGKVVARADKERDYRPGTVPTLNESSEVLIVTSCTRAFSEDILCVAYKRCSECSALSLEHTVL